MFTPDQYELVACGRGRKLERFGDRLLDRNAPAAVLSSQGAEDWGRADFQFRERSGKQGDWIPQPPDPWPVTVEVAGARLELQLKPNPVGHLGLFPEHSLHWSWIEERISAMRATDHSPPRILNLFAYTGATTLALAAMGAHVTHIDAAQNVVRWARRNAEQSSLHTSPIRWIAEDASKFVQREVRRGNRYHGVILDPPTYGHGPQGQRWQIERDLPALLVNCHALLQGQGFLLLTGHTPTMSLQQVAEEALIATRSNLEVTSEPVTLNAVNGDELDCGSVVRILR